MLAINPLSQRDKRWASKSLGDSGLSIGNYGCTITCLTCMFNYRLNSQYGVDQVNDKLKQARAFSAALVLWSNIPKAFPLNFVSRDYKYNNAKAAWYIYVKKLPVLVEVNAAKIGAARHWCLLIGDRKMIDPWTGSIVPTTTYPFTGAAFFNWS